MEKFKMIAKVDNSLLAGCISNKKIVIIGASYVAGFNLNRIRNYHLINKGVNGEQSFEMLARFDKDVITHEPDMVIIWGFINDIFRSETAKIDRTVERIKQSYIKMIDDSLRREIIPIVATEVTMGRRAGMKEFFLNLIGRILRKKSYQNYVNQLVVNVNRWLKEYALEKNVAVIDLESLLSECKGMRKKMYTKADGSHITEAGYDRLREHISQLEAKPNCGV